ncbi:MAG: hypothetical protein ABR499_23435 [Gemmatimonadaceae bacterium]
MKRFAVVAVVLAVAACAGDGQNEGQDTTVPAAGAVEAPAPATTDSAAKADSARADSVRADSAAKAAAKTKTP